MSEELRACPLCQGHLERQVSADSLGPDDYWWLHEFNGTPCPLMGFELPRTEADEWNTRPIEDELRAEIETLRAENTRLGKLALSQYHGDLAKAEERIRELKAERA